MRHIKSLVMLGLVVGTAACGSQKGGGSSAPAPQQAQTADPGVPAQVVSTDQTKLAAAPQAVIVRVKLDANGKPTGTPELRSLTGKVTLTDAAAAATAFDGAAAAAKMVKSQSELDKDTSTQSWCLGNSYGYGSANSYGYQAPSYQAPSYQAPSYQAPSYQPAYGNWNSSYYQNSYAPVLYWQGHGWNYGYSSCYNTGGYGYYNYQPSSYY